ncbi:MAG: hypothetical protein OEM93_01545 [Rhodospirillales bacterium]|nr:hypothetical protein [Rhodospirillales bacterium]MDH3790566.1 hypothetical protein [Rhodospirillales bacterium]MDH3919142.1 hypothetical protein [Rhodospirillales bacterium]MDH3967624.1 hypothetical protein [Rhodospirillales bacterium]
MNKALHVFALMALLATPLLSAEAQTPGFGELYYDGIVVGTVVPPASSPKEGRDNLYVVPDQRAVIGVAPGDTGYHGGHWAVHIVAWNVAPYVLTSEEEVLMAMINGDVTIARMLSLDFRCPVQPNG